MTDAKSEAILTEFVKSSDIELWTSTDRSGRLIEFLPDRETNGHIPVYLHREGHRILTSLTPASTWREFARRVTSQSLTQEDALRQLGTARVAANERFDMLVTDSPELLAGPFGLRPVINIRSSAEAVSSLALFLRSRDQFTLGEPRAYVRTSFWFYLVASRAAMPAASRWFSACQASTGDVDDITGPDVVAPSLRSLGQTALERVNWALRSRDKVLSAVDDSIPFYLDMFLLQISAAFDATAHVVATGLDSHVPRVDPKWRSSRWLDELSKRHSGLADVMAQESEHRDVLDIISLPRNSIHGNGLPSFGGGLGPHGSARPAVRTPQGSFASAKFHSAVNRRGGPEYWGITSMRPGATLIDPLVFVDRALVGALRALNALMDKTPVESFPNVDPIQLRDYTWSNGGPTDPWSEWTKERVVLLLGLAGKSEPGE
jgi:hypothetical protein